MRLTGKRTANLLIQAEDKYYLPANAVFWSVRQTEIEEIRNTLMATISMSAASWTIQLNAPVEAYFACVMDNELPEVSRWLYFDHGPETSVYLDDILGYESEVRDCQYTHGDYEVKLVISSDGTVQLAGYSKRDPDQLLLLSDPVPHQTLF